MNEALETLYALRIIFWCRGDKRAHRQIELDIERLQEDKTRYMYEL